MTIHRLPLPRLETVWFAAIASLVMVLALTSFVADPFGWRGARKRQMDAALDGAVSDCAARALESQGAAATVRRIEALAIAQHQVDAASAVLAGRAVNAVDADDPIGSERIERLREHDEALCRFANLRGCEDLRSEEEGR